MIIKPPLCITSRLLPGCKIGEAEISIEYAYIKNQRQHYRYFIDGVAGEYSSTNLKSKVGGGTLQEGLATLFSFLGAFVKACQTRDWYFFNFENAQLFPPDLAEWAVENATEIATMELELQEHQLIEE